MNNSAFRIYQFENQNIIGSEKDLKTLFIPLHYSQFLQFSSPMSKWPKFIKAKKKVFFTFK